MLLYKRPSIRDVVPLFYVPAPNISSSGCALQNYINSVRVGLTSKDIMIYVSLPEVYNSEEALRWLRQTVYTRACIRGRVQLPDLFPLSVMAAWNLGRNVNRNMWFEFQNQTTIRAV